MPSLPTYYISHGGGPWPWWEGTAGARFDLLRQSLNDIRAELGDTPKAVLVVSAHWETDGFMVSSASHPKMFYDYYGFPEWAYQIRYEAPGSPDLALRVAGLLEAGGIPTVADPERGFDHGTFSLMQPFYPEETMPVVQLSVDMRCDPAQHVRVGELLAPLRDEGVLIIGSGSSFHNMRLLMGGGGQAVSREFDAWLTETLVQLPQETRMQRLLNWTSAPSARIAHPQEEHLIPLMVVAGAAAADAGACVYHEDAFLGNAAMSSYRFGEPASIC